MTDPTTIPGAPSLEIAQYVLAVVNAGGGGGGGGLNSVGLGSGDGSIVVTGSPVTGSGGNMSAIVNASAITTGVLPIAQGGTGVSSASLVAGTNVTITGTWPNQTVGATAGGGGVATVASSDTSLTVTGTGAINAIVNASNVTSGTLPVAHGGTGTTTSTGSGNNVLSTSPTLVTPVLGTPSSVTLTSATGLPLTTGVTGTLPVANGGTGVTASTGTVAVVLSTSPTLVTPNLGTPSAATLTNATGLPIIAGTSGTLTVARGGTGVTTSTGSGNTVLSTSPILTTPALGTPSAVVLTSGTGLPLTTGVTGVLPVANGGTGTATPNIVAGTNITVTGTWPNQTVNAAGGGGGGGGVAPTVVFGSTVSGDMTANVTNINAALATTGGAVVNVTGTGTIYINGPIIGQSNTTLVLGPGTIIRQGPAISGSMYMSQTLLTALGSTTGTTLTGGTTVTLTQGVGSLVSVALTGHGYSVDQKVTLYGSTVTGYNGTLPILSVTDANNFVVATEVYQTAAPAGTIKCLTSTLNCNLFGGTWNYDSASQTNTANSPLMSALHNWGIADSSWDTISSINALENSFQFQASYNFRVTNLRQTGSGSSIYGPIAKFKGDGLAGTVSSGNAALNIQTKIPTNTGYQFGMFGDIHTVVYDGLVGNATSTSNQVTIQPSDSEVIDSVELGSAGGNSAAIPVNIARGTGFTTGAIRRLKFKNWQSQGNSATTPTFNFGAFSFDSITIEGWSFTPGSTLSASGPNFGVINANCVGNYLIVNQLDARAWPSNAGTDIGWFLSGAQIKNYVFNGCTFQTAVGALHMLNFGATSTAGGNVTFNDCYTDGTLAEFVYISAVPTSAVQVKLNDCQLNGTVLGLRVNAICTASIKVSGCQISSGATIASTNVAATLVTVSSGGGNTIAGTVIANNTTAPVAWNIKGADLPVDVTTTGVAVTAGQFCQSTTTGTNKQGFAVSNGTNWVAVGTGASQINTLIV